MPRYRLTQSIFHNPFRIGPDGDRNEVLAKYRVHATKLIDTNPLFKKGVMNLRGRTMGCWCCKTPVDTILPPDEQVCHGEILAELSENLFESSGARTPSLMSGALTGLLPGAGSNARLAAPVGRIQNAESIDLLAQPIRESKGEVKNRVEEAIESTSVTHTSLNLPLA